MGARVAMKRLAKMNLGFASARRLDFTIGQMSGERQVPATGAGYAPGAGFCQCRERQGSAAVMGGSAISVGRTGRFGICAGTSGWIPAFAGMTPRMG